jgi:predicted nucleic acid-binding Zn ribbon protein
VGWKPLPGSEGWRDPRPLGESLDRLSHTLGAPGATALAALFERWEDIVGPAVAAHARPLKLAGGVLTVAVDEPGWATQLTYLEADLVRRVEEVVGAGAVREVRVRVRPR